MTANWRLTDDADEFDANAGRFAASRLEYNVLATIAAEARAGAFQQVLFAYATAANGETVAAAMRADRWPMLVAGLDAVLADGLLVDWLAADAGVTGAGGPAASSRAVAGALERATRRTARLVMSEAMHSLSHVTAPPRNAAGRLRVATLEDFDLLVRWEKAFRDEASLADAGDEDRAVRARLERGGSYVWEDERPVCAVGRSRTVAAVARLGPVYTPPELRRRGYASSAVAAVSQLTLDGDAERCMLLTDLANPTSNRIYAAVGYERFADWEDYTFERDL